MSPLIGTQLCQEHVRLKFENLWKYTVHLIDFKDIYLRFSSDWHRNFFHRSKLIPRNVFSAPKSVIITSFLSVKYNYDIWLLLCFYFHRSINDEFFTSLCYSDVSRNFKEKQKFAIENTIPTLSDKPCFKHQEWIVYLQIIGIRECTKLKSPVLEILKTQLNKALRTLN